MTRDDDSGRSGLSVSGLRHSFGSRLVLADVDLHVEPGEIVCLLGPSGCGKTTTLRLIAGLEGLQAGRISWNGTVLADAAGAVPPERRGVSLLFQDFALFPHLTVAQNVAFGLVDMAGAERDGRVREVLGQVGMLEYADSYPHRLSGGEQQRVALARARAPRPPIILLDEPFSNLDTQRRNQLRDLCLHVLKRARSASLVVTHNAEEAMFMADRLAVMRDGAIVQSGSPEEIYFRPSSIFVAGLFGELNEVPGRVGRGRVETPLGAVDAAHIADGTEVIVLIRPEAVAVVSPDGAAATGRVMAARLLGRTSLLHLSVAGGGSSELHLHARVTERPLPPEGSVVGLRLDRQNVFVFPAERARA